MVEEFPSASASSASAVVVEAAQGRIFRLEAFTGGVGEGVAVLVNNDWLRIITPDSNDYL